MTNKQKEIIRRLNVLILTHEQVPEDEQQGLLDALIKITTANLKKEEVKQVIERDVSLVYANWNMKI